MSNIIKFPITLEQRNEQVEEFIEEREFEYVRSMVEADDYINRALHMIDKGFVMDEEDMEIISQLQMKLKYLEARYYDKK